jgi:hypothetical protein
MERESDLFSYPAVGLADRAKKGESLAISRPQAAANDDRSF